MKKLVLIATTMSFLGSSVFADILTFPGDPILAVQLQNGNTIEVATQSTANTPGTNTTPQSGNENAPFSIDGDNGTKYLNFGETNTGIVVDPSNDTLLVTGLELITGNDSADRDPASFSIYGTNVSQSTTFSDYTLIVANQPILGTDPGRNASSGLVTFANPFSLPFDSYLVIFPTVRDASVAVAMQVSEIRLDGVPEPTVALTFVSGLGLLGLLRHRRSA